jgi:hypothetical protein
LNIIGHRYSQTPAALATDFRRQKRRSTPQAPDVQTVFPVPPPLPSWARNAPPVTDTAPRLRDTIAEGAATKRLAETLQLKLDDALRAAIAEVQQLAASAQAAPLAAAQAARVVVAQRADAEILALWLADAVLAARLRWPRPLPLIAGALVHPSLRSSGHRPYPGDATWTLTCCVAYGRAAVAACDLFADLGRSSQKLIAVAPRLRARGAGAVIETLLNEDAVPAAARRDAISARGSRRLFDRLVALGGVRELTGRSTFRLYGL